MTISITTEEVASEVLSSGRFGGRVCRLASHNIRFSIATLDVLQIIGIGFTTARLLPNVNQMIDSRETAVVAITASALAVAFRLAIRATTPACNEAPWTNSASAAWAAVLAVVVVGVEHRLAFPLLLPLPALGLWLLLWGTLTAAIASLLRTFSKQLLRTIAIPSYFFLIGEAEHTDKFAAILATMPVTFPPNRAVRINDRNPTEITGLSLYPLRQDDVALLVAETMDAVRINEVCKNLADFPGKICLAIRAPSVGPLPRIFPRLGDYLVIDLVTDPHGGIRGAIKRLIDVVGAGMLLVLLFPLMLCVAVLICLETPGPVLFRQQRFGIGSQPIEVLKFRTMHAARGDTSGAHATVARDPRVTLVGRVLRRLSIDELPQLLNVLRGDMSLVGPRPHPLYMRVEGAYYHDIIETYRARHRVKPGITGWAQINGSRGAVDTLEKAQRRVALDIWYLNHWSLSLDGRILLFTVLGGFISVSAD